MTCAIGSLSVFAIEGDLLPARAKVSSFKQFGAAGVGMIIGADEQPTSKLKSISFSNTRSTQDTLKKAAAALVGTVVTVTRDVGGSAVSVTNCFVKDATPVKGGAGAGMPGSATFVTEIEWEIITPVDW